MILKLMGRIIVAACRVKRKRRDVYNVKEEGSEGFIKRAESNNYYAFDG